jgi:hypothetical protein
MLVWALVIGYLVWGDVPTLALISGAGIVVGCGLFLLWHEAKGGRPVRSTAVAAENVGVEILHESATRQDRNPRS